MPDRTDPAPEPGVDPAFDRAVRTAYEASMWRLKPGICVNGSWLFALGWFEQGELWRAFEGCGCTDSGCIDEPLAEAPLDILDEHWHGMGAACFASDAPSCRSLSAENPEGGFRLP